MKKTRADDLYKVWLESWPSSGHGDLVSVEMTLVCGQLQLILETPRGVRGFLDNSYYRFSQVAVDVVEIACARPGHHSIAAVTYPHTNRPTTMHMKLILVQTFTHHKHWI